MPDDAIARKGNGGGDVSGGGYHSDDEVEEQSSQVSDAPGVKEKLDTLEKRYATLLELLGEGEEHIRELITDYANRRDFQE